MAFLSESQVKGLGFRAVGAQMLISDRASFYGLSQIDIGARCRIDDYCLISAGEGGIRLGRNVHVSSHSSIVGAATIELSDFAGVSSRVSIFSSSDDFSGASLTGPTIPSKFTNVDSRPVYIGRHAIIGSGSVILPGIRIGDGAAIGALSLVDRDCREFGIYSGRPVRFLMRRSRELLKVEDAYMEEVGQF